MNFLNSMRYQVKNSLRDKGFIFWILLYPILMSLFFQLSLGSVKFENLKGSVPIAAEKDSQISQVGQFIDILKIKNMTPEEAKEKLGKDKITAFVDKDLNVEIARNGFKESIVFSITNQIKQMNSLGYFPLVYNFNENFTVKQETEGSSFSIYFFALISMVSLYGIFQGIELIQLYEANQSPIGARISISPQKKLVAVLYSSITGLILNMTSNLILLLFLDKVLSHNFITDYPRTLLIIFLGNLVGIALGLFIGVILKSKFSIKNSLAIGITLFLAFLSGMMGSGIKSTIDLKFPIAKIINPVNIITTEIYKINELTKHDTLLRSSLILISMWLVFTIISVLFLRRKQYDSI